MGAELLPEIDAERFDSKPIQKSSSGKVYLFETSIGVPKTGNLIIIYDQNKPAMAFRVLQNNPLKKQFVGKRVRRYGDTGELSLNHSYSSIEKIADALPAPPAIAGAVPLQENDASLDTKENDAALDEPEKGAPIPTKLSSSKKEKITPEELSAPDAQDPELDSSTTAGLDRIDENDDSVEEENPITDIEEMHRIDPSNNILTVSAGFFANSSNFSTSPQIHNGFSVSYAHVLIHDLFIKTKVPQDSLALELGTEYYRIVNQDGINDIYTLLPFYADLFYQLHLSAGFSFNLYGGMQFNYIASYVNSGPSYPLLHGPQPNFGIGFFYTIGPQWLLRADIGWDRITGGLSVKW